MHGQVARFVFECQITKSNCTKAKLKKRDTIEFQLRNSSKVQTVEGISYLVGLCEFIFISFCISKSEGALHSQAPRNFRDCHQRIAEKEDFSERC